MDRDSCAIAKQRYIDFSTEENRRLFFETIRLCAEDRTWIHSRGRDDSGRTALCVVITDEGVFGALFTSIENAVRIPRQVQEQYPAVICSPINHVIDAVMEYGLKGIVFDPYSAQPIFIERNNLKAILQY